MANPVRALIIDDDPDLLLLVRRTLEFTAGWQVVTADSGAAGMELARSTRPPPQVIVVDIMMPGIDGYEVCRRLKRDPLTAQVPIVLFTARRDLNQRQLAESGANGVVFKPFQPAELAQQVWELCQ
jgi:CheY-like chemotaxis protein